MERTLADVSLSVRLIVIKMLLARITISHSVYDLFLALHTELLSLLRTANSLGGLVWISILILRPLSVKMWIVYVGLGIKANAGEPVRLKLDKTTHD